MNYILTRAKRRTPRIIAAMCPGITIPAAFLAAYSLVVMLFLPELGVQLLGVAGCLAAMPAAVTLWYGITGATQEEAAMDAILVSLELDLECTPKDVPKYLNSCRNDHGIMPHSKEWAYLCGAPNSMAATIRRINTFRNTGGVPLRNNKG